MSYFLRDYLLQINTAPKGSVPTVFSFKNHRIEFEIEKSVASAPSIGHIKVYNIHKDLRRVLGKRIFDLQDGPFINLNLSAGYKDSIFTLINGGSPISFNERKVPDWITNFQIYSNIEDFNSLIFDDTNGQFDGLNLESSITRFIGLLLGTNAISNASYTDSAKQIIKSNLAPIKSNVFSGKIWYDFKTLLSKYNLSYYWDNDITIYKSLYDAQNPNDSVKPAGTIFTLSTSTGLIGAPVITLSGITCRALLNPNIRVLRRIAVESDVFLETFNVKKREFVPTKVSYKGDSRGDAWYVEFTAAYGDIITT